MNTKPQNPPPSDPPKNDPRAEAQRPGGERSPAGDFAADLAALAGQVAALTEEVGRLATLQAHPAMSAPPAPPSEAVEWAKLRMRCVELSFSSPSAALPGGKLTNAEAIYSYVRGEVEPGEIMQPLGARRPGEPAAPRWQF